MLQGTVGLRAKLNVLYHTQNQFLLKVYFDISKLPFLGNNLFIQWINSKNTFDRKIANIFVICFFNNIRARPSTLPHAEPLEGWWKYYLFCENSYKETILQICMVCSQNSGATHGSWDRSAWSLKFRQYITTLYISIIDAFAFIHSFIWAIWKYCELYQ